MHRRPPPARAPPPRLPPKIDRAQNTPSLVRVFVKNNTHHDDSEFTVTNQPVRDEYQVYTWSDTTLRELVLLLRDAAPALRANPLARFSVRLVFFESDRDRYTSREIGIVAAQDLLKPSREPVRRPDHRADRTLAEARFVIGDWIDVAYLGGPAGPLPPMGGPAGPPHGRAGPGFGHGPARGGYGGPGGESAAPRGWGPGRGGHGGVNGPPPGRSDARGPPPPGGRRDGPVGTGNWPSGHGEGIGASRNGVGRAEREGRWGGPAAGDRPPPPRRRSRSQSPRRRSPSPPRPRSRSRSPPPPARD